MSSRRWIVMSRRRCRYAVIGTLILAFGLWPSSPAVDTAQAGGRITKKFNRAAKPNPLPGRAAGSGTAGRSARARAGKKNPLRAQRARGGGGRRHVRPWNARSSVRRGSEARKGRIDNLRAWRSNRSRATVRTNRKARATRASRVRPERRMDNRQRSLRARRNAAGKRDRSQMSAMLRDAARGRGNFGIGTATREQARAMGVVWVGKRYRIASDGKTLVSANGRRQYRPPSYKPSLKKFQANFETRPPGVKKWQTNAHLDIRD